MEYPWMIEEDSEQLASRIRFRLDGVEVTTGAFAQWIRELTAKRDQLLLQLREVTDSLCGKAVELGKCTADLNEANRLLGEERERCAKIAETTEPFPPGASVSPMDSTERWMVRNMRERIAAAIRQQTEKRVDPLPTIEDLLGECRECNRLVRDCGNHGPVQS